MERRRRNSRQPHLRVSMADVATEVGVSLQTVSRAMRDAPGISAATREEILAVAQRLGYRRNRIAETLATGNSQIIGVLSGSPELHGPGVELHAIIEAAQQVGFQTIVQSTGSESMQERKLAIDRLISQGAGGVVILGPQRLSPGILDDVHPDYPLLIIGRRLGRRPMIGGNTRAVMPELVSHLAGLGHRHIGLITGAKEDWATKAPRATITQAIKDLGLPPVTVVEGDWTARSGAAAVEPILQRGEITAVIASNDQMAIGFIGAAQSRGLRVPDDLSVTGMDDFPESAWIHPALTTIAIDHQDVGRRAFALIHRQITEQGYRPPAVTASRSSRLIVRASTGPARAHRLLPLSD